MTNLSARPGTPTIKQNLSKNKENSAYGLPLTRGIKTKTRPLLDIENNSSHSDSGPKTTDPCLHTMFSSEMFTK